MVPQAPKNIKLKIKGEENSDITFFCLTFYPQQKIVPQTHFPGTGSSLETGAKFVTLYFQNAVLCSSCRCFHPYSQLPVFATSVIVVVFIFIVTVFLFVVGVVVDYDDVVVVVLN
jgi:hypothetical protein